MIKIQMKEIKLEENMIEYKLLEHQAEAITKNDKNYDKHNVTGSVMPTGTGKSFIAMAHIISINNPYYTGVDENGIIRVPVGEDGAINKSKILYVAPTNEIAEQIKIDIAKYVYGIDLDKRRNELIQERIKQTGEPKELIEDSVNESIISERDKIVKRAFPNLMFKCYKTLAVGVDNHNKGKKDAYDPYLDEPDLVILDEVHRSGAQTYQQGTAALLGCKIENGEVVKDKNAIEAKKNIKVLSISATPERDVDSRDMTKVWAKALGGYTEEELSDQVRADLGIKMTLPDAINKGILRNPNVIHFDCNLGEKDEYKALVRIVRDEKLDVKIRDKAREAIERINTEVIGIKNYDQMNEKQKAMAREEKEIEILAKAIDDGLFNIHGKFILFAPKDTVKNNPENEYPFLEKYADKIVQKLKKALERSNKNSEIIVDCISSTKDNEENKRILSSFDAKDITTGAIHIVVAQEKFNEGVHAKNISGGFNTRLITEQKNTTLRAQSILFLQQKGRFDAALIKGKEPPPMPTIFDMCNNFYTQNINGAVDPEQRIPIFELTEKQKILHESYMKMMEMVPAKVDITVKLPRLLQITNILREYGVDINFETINEKTKLLELVKREKYEEYKDEILERLEQIGAISKKGKKYVDFNIGSALKKARESFWNGTKFFGEYSIEELKSSGIIDESTPEYKKYAEKYVKDGFFIMGVAKEFIYKNINTGDEYNEEGKDIDGYDRDQFDPETGLDENNCNRRGFNAIIGMHKDTGTIHDKSGFMANGINIQTGTEFDPLGYNIDGIKPFKNSKGKIVGGFDKEHYFHEYNEESKTYCKIREGQLAPYEEGKKVNEFGFISGGKKNVYTNSEYTPYPNAGFMNNGLHRNGKAFNDAGYNIEGFNEFDFNLFGINKQTGTRFDQFGRKASYYKKESVEIRHLIRNMQAKAFKIENGKIIRQSDKTELSNVRGFIGNGTNLTTGELKDIYGFTIADYYLPTRQGSSARHNQYGFYAYEVDNISMAAELQPGGKNSVYKYYGYGENRVAVNILGTDKFGHILDSDRKITNKLHPSLKIAASYIENCVKKDATITAKQFYENYAIENKMLYEEAKCEVLTSLNQAVTLYRICPELAKTKEVKEVMQILYNASPEKLNKFFGEITGGKDFIRRDTEELKKKIQEIDKQIENSNDQRNKERLKKKNYALKKRLEDLGKLPKQSGEVR